MLMQPQQPTPPNPNYEFIMKDAPKKKMSLPSLDLPKPAKYILLGLGGLIVVIVLFSLLGGGPKGGTGVTNLMAEQQEIVRVSTLAQTLTKDSTTQALVATVNASVSSEQSELAGYLGKNAPRSNSKLLAKDKNASTDLVLNGAVQKNNLETTYDTYLRQALGAYQTDLNQAFKDSKSSSLKAILSRAYQSTQTLLSSFPLKTT